MLDADRGMEADVFAAVGLAETAFGDELQHAIGADDFAVDCVAFLVVGRPFVGVAQDFDGLLEAGETSGIAFLVGLAVWRKGAECGVDDFGTGTRVHFEPSVQVVVGEPIFSTHGSSIGL